MPHQAHLDIEHASSSLVITSEPLPESGRFLWIIKARTFEQVKIETDKLANAVSDDSFVVFTYPKMLTGEHSYAGWFASTGITYNLI